MKSNKSHHAAPKSGRKASLKKLGRYIDKEVTLIHENLEDLKCFLGEHASMTEDIDLHASTKEINDYYDSASDLFRQIALETSQDPPIEAKFYETLLLRKKKKRPDAAGS
ncbi:MAG: hypothetical protein JXA71_19615 [Chitinispirillaceae bacterium]|nr:hypothetical protein [Chitinispirillaceae bacterium]